MIGKIGCLLPLWVGMSFVLGEIMKLWKCIVLGIGLWGVSLIWPDINQALTSEITIKLVLGLGTIWLIYELEQSITHHHKHDDGKRHNGHTNNHHS
jgi:hypothetical protein